MSRSILVCATAVALASAGRLHAQASPAPTDTTVGLPQEILTIAVGQTRVGRLEPGDWVMADGTYADVWYFIAAAGQRVTIELRSTSRLDPYMQLLDPFGAKLAEDDDSLGNRGSRIIYTVREAGRYQIVVNYVGDEPQTGSYLLTLR